MSSRAAAASEPFRRGLNLDRDSDLSELHIQFSSLGVGFMTPCEVLVTFVAFEIFRGSASPWKRYLDHIEPTTPVQDLAVAALAEEDSGINATIHRFRRARLIREHFASSRYATRALLDAVEQRLELSAAMAAAFQASGLFQRLPQDPKTPSTTTVQYVFLWANAIVQGRALRMSGPPLDGVCSLIPIWDLINHAAADSRLSLSEDGETIHVSGGMEDPSGEILHSYGCSDNCVIDWLLQFGFVSSEIQSAALSYSEDSPGLDVDSRACAEITIAGQTLVVRATAESHTMLAQAAEGDLDTILAALKYRAKELPAANALRDVILHSEGIKKDAAVVMLMERQALHHAHISLSPKTSRDRFNKVGAAQFFEL